MPGFLFPRPQALSLQFATLQAGTAIPVPPSSQMPWILWDPADASVFCQASCRLQRSKINITVNGCRKPSGSNKPQSLVGTSKPLGRWKHLALTLSSDLNPRGDRQQDKHSLLAGANAIGVWSRKQCSYNHKSKLFFWNLAASLFCWLEQCINPMTALPDSTPLTSLRG